MRSHARIVIIGAGIVGCSVAYHLARLGWREIVVLDQGRLFETGGSTSHAPGLVFQTNTSETMCRLAQATVALYRELAIEEGAAFYQVGSIELATTAERWQDLHRRVGYARSWGLDAELVGPQEAQQLLPLLNASAVRGGYVVPTDGIAKAVRACTAMTAYAQQSGAAAFLGETVVCGIEHVGGRVSAVTTSKGRIETEQVLIAAGIWGPLVGRLAGVTLPLTPVQHQYVRTTPLAELQGETREAVHPILRHQDRAMYFRQHGECYGIGSYQHAPLLVDPAAIRQPNDGPLMPSLMPFTPEDFAQPWADAQKILPALQKVDQAQAINGMFSFTPDSLPLLGETASIRGLWVAEAVWVTHGGGVGQVMAQWLDRGQAEIDMRECDLNRFEPHALSPVYVRARGAQQYREVYDIIHPLQQLEQPRPLRVSPFYERERALGAVFFEGRGWERPQWYTANEPLLKANQEPRIENQECEIGVGQFRMQNSKLKTRSDWSARNWSPIALAEHEATRERVALYDMTPLTRLELSGSSALALLDKLTTSKLDRPIGSVVYTAMCDERGGIKSDITVTRLAEDRFQIGCNGPLDHVWLVRHLPADGSAHLRDSTAATCCVGVWGPLARSLLQHLADTDCSNIAFPYMHARSIFVGEVPVLAQRISYVGELGWELYASADYGVRLWDLLWDAGQPYGVTAGGRAAFDALRIEKGYRLWGADMYSEHTPYEAGIGFVVKLDKGEFIGRTALFEAKARGTQRKLCCLVLDDPMAVMLGKEPLLEGERVLGYVTSAAYGASVGKSIAYGYLPVESADEGSRIAIESFGERYTATVTREPLFDPKGERLRM